MNERQRADQLARAIDELINGTPRPGHEIATDADIRQTVAARREMSAAILSLAARHKDEVWRRIQERIKGRRGSRGGPPSPGSAGGDPSEPPMRTRFFPTGDADIDSLLAVALNRPTLRDLSAHSADSSQRKLHERRRGDPARQWRADLALPQGASRTSWAPLAAAGAIVLLVIAALGPVPGLAHSPAVEAARYVGQHLGVIETDAPPPTPGPATTVLPEDVTPQQASHRLGLPVAAPDAVFGLPQASLRYFPAGLTSDRSGVFVIAYEAADGSSAVSLYQEAAAGDASLAVPSGMAVDTSIGGIGATYFEGGWTQSGGALSWLDAGTQTLLFERGGLRTTVQYTGPQINMDTLTAAATMLVAPPS